MRGEEGGGGHEYLCDVHILGLKWRASRHESWNNCPRDKNSTTEIEKFFREKLLFFIETDIDHLNIPWPTSEYLGTDMVGLSLAKDSFLPRQSSWV